MLSIPDLIKKKRDGGEFSDDEIKAFIRAVTMETIQECQTGAMLMAIWQKGMVASEIESLTREMMSSGEVMSWPEEWKRLVVDKHSTGGVGDKVSLVLAPALAACGCKVPMISGRGLAHTGGTLDKLESIPGFNIHQSTEQVPIIYEQLLHANHLNNCSQYGATFRHRLYIKDGRSRHDVIYWFVENHFEASGLAFGRHHLGFSVTGRIRPEDIHVHTYLHKILEILGSVGCCIVGQTEMLVPADRVLYAVRDATSTVDNLPLITGSIISKKGAESLSALVLDVKFGRAALYKDLESAKELAQLLVKAGSGLGIRTGAILSSMDGTIGRCVGNSLEVIESLETLKGNGPDDLMELVTTLGGMLLLMTGLVSDQSEGRKKISDAVIGGAALSKFQAMMEAQGVANETARRLCSAHSEYYSVLRKAERQLELKVPADGAVLGVDGLALAQVLHQLGAGRSKVGEPVNHRVGAELLVSPGQRVRKGASWLRLHHEDPAPTADQTSRLQSALRLGADRNTEHSLVKEVLLST